MPQSLSMCCGWCFAHSRAPIRLRSGAVRGCAQQRKAGFVRVDRCRERITPLNCSLNRALGLGNNLSIETTTAFAGVFLLGVMIIAAILPLLTFKA